MTFCPRSRQCIRFTSHWLLYAAAIVLTMSGGLLTADELRQPEWGTLAVDPVLPGAIRADVQSLAEGGALPLPTPFQQLIRVRYGQANDWTAGDFQFDREATQLDLPPVHGSADKPSPRTNAIVLETADKSQQFADGRFVFVAGDAQVEGNSAKLERHPGNDRIGFWTNPRDRVSWDFTASRWGMYRVWLTYSCASPDGTRMEVSIGDATVAGQLKSTGSWYRYTSIDLGLLYLPVAGQQSLTVRCLEKVGGAVMNLKAVILDPACEGTPPVQSDDGVVTLHGRDATVHGMTLRYEPAEKKQTLGYWVRAEDWAEWTFTISDAGGFDVEVLQGCGSGQGGSSIAVRVGEKQLDFEVEETGHFQNFVPRTIGRVILPQPGTYTLAIQPQRIAHKAACDVRQIRLLPLR